MTRNSIILAATYGLSALAVWLLLSMTRNEFGWMTSVLGDSAEVAKDPNQDFKTGLALSVGILLVSVHLLLLWRFQAVIVKILSLFCLVATGLGLTIFFGR